MVIVGLILVLLQAVVSAGLLYHYFLLLTGGRPHRSAAAGPEPEGRSRFAVALPAHNEESVIGATVSRLREMDYPADRFDVHVAADYCTDGTEQAARTHGAIVHERNDGPRGRKGYPLAWLLNQLLEDPKQYDAVAVFDADSRVSTDFLSLMNRALGDGAQVLQGRHVIANPGVSVFSTLADADMRLNNRIRNQAKENLGLSARLMGDGMCFSRGILERYPFGAASLTEDREYGIHLVTEGQRVSFVPEAISSGQATRRWKDATGQRLRWYGGVSEIRKRYLRPLLAAAWRERSLAALDLALETCLPPFSVLAVLSVALLGIQGVLRLLGFQFSLEFGIILAVMAIAYPFLGLFVERAPLRSYAALAYGPFYAVWRMWLNLTVWVRRGQVPWIRTRRAEEESSQT